MKQTPKKAILLAAGFGTRIQPLSYDLPKPMMPVWGKPAVLHMVNLMKTFGVRQVLINLHHNASPLFDYFRANPVRDMKIEFSFEPEILGTGGALKKAEWFIDDSPFWIANTDIAADVPPEPFLTEFQKRNPVAVLWLNPEQGPLTVEMKNNRISEFRSRTPGGRNTFTFCGLQLVSPEILKYLPGSAFSTIIHAYLSAMSKGRRVSGVAVEKSFWSDMGTPGQYLETHRQILERYRQGKAGARLLDPVQLHAAASFRRKGVIINGFASIGGDTKIEPGASITDSVIWNGAVITTSSVLKDAVIARNTFTRGQLSGPAVCAGSLREDTGLLLALKRISWPADKTTVIPLCERGSQRSFTRLLHGNRSMIYIHYNPEREENVHYARIARFLRHEGIPVPRIVLDSPENCTTVMEDLGDCPLEAYAQRHPKGLEACYRKVLDALLTLHGVPPSHATKSGTRLQPPFSRKLYMWERGLMAEHFLSNWLKLDRKTIHKITADLESVAAKLIRTRHGLLHRDMQSSNILLRNNRPYFIDFQGLRLGPAAYDVASLLCDPYVMLQEDLQIRLLDYYVSESRDNRTVADTFWYAAVERLAQALGAYGRLCSSAGTKRFAGYMNPALKMMSRALSHLDGLVHLKELTCKFAD